MENQKIFVAIAGNIGAGKTTLARLLGERYGWQSHFEAVDNNPYLSDFYRDMARWSFQLQIFFLNDRFQVHKNISQGTNSAIQDRCIYEDANIFARNLYEQGMMEKRDYFNYLDLYSTIVEHLDPPDLIIYLRKSMGRLKDRISMRGRDYEHNIPDEYLANLNRYYDDWMENYDAGKKLIIESDWLDFVENPSHFNELGSQIFDQLDQKELFLDKDAKMAHSII